MNFRIVFTDRDYSSICKQHNQTVADRAKRQIAQTNETLQWVDTLGGCSNRFDTIISQEPHYFAEIGFTARGSDYRAIIAWLPDSEIFTPLYVLEKEEYYQSSEQHDIINNIIKHSTRHISQAEKRVSSELTASP